MNPLLLENLQRYDILENWNTKVEGTKSCTLIKLKLKPGISIPFDEASKTCEGQFRFYLEVDGFVNYVSENVAMIWKNMIMFPQCNFPKKKFGNKK